MDNRPHILLAEPIIVNIVEPPPRTLGVYDTFTEINGIKVLITKSVDLDRAYVITKKYDGNIYFAHKTNVKDTQVVNDAKVYLDQQTAQAACDIRNGRRQKIKYSIEKANIYFVYNISSSMHTTSHWDKPNYRYVHIQCSRYPIKQNSYDKNINLPNKVDHKIQLKNKNTYDINYHLKSIKELEDRIEKERKQVKEYEAINQLIETIDFNSFTENLKTENQDQIELLYGVSK